MRLLRTSRQYPISWIAGALTVWLVLMQAGAATYTVTDLGDTHQINGFNSKVLNDQGQVIGNQIGDNGGAFLYSNGSWNSLGHLNNSGSGNTSTVALGLNNSGRVVGQSDTGNSGAVLD